MSTCLPFNTSTIEFKMEFLKNISNVTFDYNRNLTRDEVICLLNYIKQKPFKVVELDKNVGVGIINKKLYDSLCLEFLSNIDNYEKIENDPFENSCYLINEKLYDLFLCKNLSKKLYDKLKINQLLCKVGSFRILPKIHKDKFSIRPIVNCLNHFTSDLCLLVDLILRPFVIRCESFLKDSQHLNLLVPSGYGLISGDFESLYNNIILETALNVICDFIKDKFYSEHINILAFRSILEMEI